MDDVTINVDILQKELSKILNFLHVNDKSLYLLHPSEVKLVELIRNQIPFGTVTIVKTQDGLPQIGNTTISEGVVKTTKFT